MKITLDEYGQCIPDVQIRGWALYKLYCEEDIHISNVSTLNGIRALLYDIRPENRPQIEWEFYGKKVLFDDNMRSDDAWRDDRMNIEESFLCTLLNKPYWKETPSV